MSAHVLLNLLNKFGARLASHFISFSRVRFYLSYDAKNILKSHFFA